MDVALLQKTYEISENFNAFKTLNSLYDIPYKYCGDAINSLNKIFENALDVKRCIIRMDKYFGKSIPSRYATKKIECVIYLIENDIEVLQDRLENIEDPRMLDESDEDFFDDDSDQ